MTQLNQFFGGGNQARRDARHSVIKLRSGSQSPRNCSLLFSFFGLFVGGLILRGKSLVLFSGLLKLAHVLVEVRASLEGNQQLGFLTTFSAVPAIRFVAGDGNRHGADRLEHGVFISDEVLRGNDACGDRIAKGMQLDGLVDLEIALAEEDVKVGVLLDRDVDLVRVLRARIDRLLRGILLLSWLIHLVLFGLLFHSCYALPSDNLA